MNKWFTIKSLSNENAEISIYDEIGQGLFSGVDAKGFIDELQALGHVNNISLHLNSPGGSVFEGAAIFNALKRNSAFITVYIEGLAASTASLIAMAGDRVEMSENSLFMIHNPWSLVSGNADEFRKMADVLDKTKSAMISGYMAKTKKSEQEISDLMSAETWFTPDEANQSGFIDGVTKALPVAASFDLSLYNNVPKVIKMTTKTSQVKAEILAAEQTRRSDIKATFMPFEEREGMRELMDSCLDDLSISGSRSRDILLCKLGEGAEPLATSPYFEAGDGGRNDNFMTAAIDALLIRNGLTVKDPHPAFRDIRGMSLLGMVETLLSQRDRSFSGFSANQVIVAAMSTSDFPLLLENAANKSLMMGYENEPASHRLWVREVEVKDFKDQKRIAVSEAPGLLKVLEGGEYKEGSLGERGESYSLATYGRILSLTRQSIINDDLGGFTRIPQAFGSSAARLESDKVYQILTSNPIMSDGVALFHASHGNLMSASALSVTSLGEARAAMRKQKGINGDGVLNLIPRYLIVPAALETASEQLLSSLVDPSKSNNTTNTAWIRSLELVVDARLDDNSATEWYLAANTSQVDTVEIAHLDGQRGVFTEQEQTFVTDGLRLKARLDFAAQAIDWVGMVRNMHEITSGSKKE